MATRNRPLANQHQASYRQRRKLALQPIAKPWDFMTAAEVKEMAMKAYDSAWNLKSGGGWQLHGDGVPGHVCRKLG
jgi:hypothetical protein